MVKYYIYGEGTKKPIQRKKHETDAFVFVSDIKNLQRFGCMSIVREDDSGHRQRWNDDTDIWESEEEEEDPYAF